jgi:hypothetical protein
MGNTARYGWGYPEVTDSPNLSLYVKNLANAVETTVGTIDDAVAAAATIGTMVGDSGAITADAPSAWSSATKVLTNVVCSFAGFAGYKYEVIANVNWTCAAASRQEAMGIAWKAGALAATDALAGVVGPRTHPDGTGFNSTTIYGTLTAAVTATHNVGVVGWKLTGDTGSSQLRANGTWAINRITVKRVA